jgi:hypothetical protein
MPADPGEGGVIGPPNFIGVAAPRCGTTWWFKVLCAHPQIVAPVTKELHFFDGYLNGDVDEETVHEYHRHFRRLPEQVAGEWTPRYALDPWTPRQLAIAAPEAQLLVLLRDPIDRFRSDITRSERWTHELSSKNVFTNFARGRYAIQLRRLLQYFQAEQILLLQYERCLQSPRESLREILDFLGVDSSYESKDLEERVNRFKEPPPVVPDDLRAQLVHDYSDEMMALADQWEQIDLSLWPNFAHLARP